MLSDMLTITCLTSTNVQILTAVCLCGQMLSDILTIVEHRGSYEGMKLAFVGDCQVCNCAALHTFLLDYQCSSKGSSPLLETARYATVLRYLLCYWITNAVAKEARLCWRLPGMQARNAAVKYSNAVVKENFTAALLSLLLRYNTLLLDYLISLALSAPDRTT